MCLEPENKIICLTDKINEILPRASHQFVVTQQQCSAKNQEVSIFTLPNSQKYYINGNCVYTCIQVVRYLQSDSIQEEISIVKEGDLLRVFFISESNPDRYDALF